MKARSALFAAAFFFAVGVDAQPGPGGKKSGRVAIHEAKDDPDSYARVDQLKCPAGFHAERAAGPHLKLKKQESGGELKGKKKRLEEGPKERQLGEFRCAVDPKP